MIPSKNEIRREYYLNTKIKINNSKNDGIILKLLPQYYTKIVRLQKELHDHFNNVLACRSGCSFCCYLNVELCPQEVFLIWEYMHHNFDSSKIKGIKFQVYKNSENIKGVSTNKRLQINIKCPFLNEDNSCSIYEVRPFNCRNFHSISVDLCKYSFDNPNDMNSPISYDQRVKEILEYATNCFYLAHKETGFDQRVYNLSLSLLEMFENNKNKKRWKKKKNAFSKNALGLIEIT